MVKHLDIRLLKTDADWLAFQALRLSALHNAPEAFASSYEEEVIMSIERFKDAYKKCDVFGAFIGNSLVGSVGFFMQSPIKMQHRGVLFSMYVAPTCRNQGIANLLMKSLIEHAPQSVLQIHATVVTNNLSALNLYQKHGFVIYGTEPRSLKIEEHFYDEHMMVLILND